MKLFNIVRKGLSVESTARLIKGILISAYHDSAEHAHPFIGREEELRELEKQVMNHDRPESRMLFISGNFGSGRKTIARQFYKNQFPQVRGVFPVVELAPFSGLEEIYRKILITLRPTIGAKELRTCIEGFAIVSTDQKRQLGCGLN